MIRPLEGTSPASDLPQPQRKPGRQAQAAVTAASLTPDTVKLGKLATPPKTISLRSKTDAEVRDLVEEAKAKVLLVTEGIPTSAMVKMLRKAAKDDISVVVRFRTHPNEPEVTKTFREAAIAKLRDAGVSVSISDKPAAGPKAAPNATTSSGTLWVDY